MKYNIRCQNCNTESWVKGEDEEETNSCEVDPCPECDSDDVIILDSEYDDDSWIEE